MALGKHRLPINTPTIWRHPPCTHLVAEQAAAMEGQLAVQLQQLGLGGAGQRVGAR